jgi:hypothetical protein
VPDPEITRWAGARIQIGKRGDTPDEIAKRAIEDLGIK